MSPIWVKGLPLSLCVWYWRHKDGKGVFTVYEAGGFGSREIAKGALGGEEVGKYGPY